MSMVSSRFGLRFLLPAAAILAITFPAEACASARITGKWLTEDETQVMEIASCGEGRSPLCVRVLKNLPGSPGEAAGTKVIWDLEDTGKQWKGKGYNKAHGVSYRALLSISGKRLQIRGCKAFICQDSYWTPVP